MLVLSTTQYTVEAAQWAQNNHWNKIRSDRKCIWEAVADRECIPRIMCTAPGDVTVLLLSPDQRSDPEEYG